MKSDLQAQLDARGVKYDKRWGEAKLKLALEGAIIERVKPEDKPSVPELTPEAEERSQLINEEAEKTVQAIRENAKIVKEQYAMKKLEQDGRIVKESGKIFVKREVSDGVEIYEKVSNKFIRVYTKSIHGEGYKELADKFIEGRKKATLSFGKVKPRLIIPH
jgi:hypothetical protein